jgi:predicted DNA-binding transcriptional regulator AlpA
MRLLTYDRLKEKGVPWCRDHLRRKAKAGEFPAPIQISDSRIAWDEAEIDAWMKARAAEREPKAA